MKPRGYGKLNAGGHTTKQLLVLVDDYLARMEPKERGLIHAIRRVRLLTGKGLAESKAWVEKHAAKLVYLKYTGTPPAKPLIDETRFAETFVENLRDRGATQLASAVEESYPVLHIRREIGRVLALAKRRGVKIRVVQPPLGTDGGSSIALDDAVLWEVTEL